MLRAQSGAEYVLIHLVCCSETRLTELSPASLVGMLQWKWAGCVEPKHCGAQMLRRRH